MIVPTQCRETCCIQIEETRYWYSSEAQVGSLPSFSPLLRDWKKEGLREELVARLTFVSFYCAIACHLCCFFFEFALLSLYVWGQYVCTLTRHAVTVLCHKGRKMYWYWLLQHDRNMCHSLLFRGQRDSCGDLRLFIFFHYMLRVTSPLDFLFQVPEILRDTADALSDSSFGFHTTAPLAPKNQQKTRQTDACCQWLHEEISSFCWAVAGFCNCISKGSLHLWLPPSSQSVDYLQLESALSTETYTNV